MTVIVFGRNVEKAIMKFIKEHGRKPTKEELDMIVKRKPF